MNLSINKPIDISVKELTQDDQANWLTLWDNYLVFYQTSLTDEVTQSTWQKLLTSDNMHGFGAFVDNELVGIVHVLFHPNTWNVQDYCYLEDLYVSESVRGQGVGRALIQHVYEFAKNQGCSRVYWTTQEHNHSARKLYDTLATQSDMIQYRHNF